MFVKIFAIKWNFSKTISTNLNIPLQTYFDFEIQISSTWILKTRYSTKEKKEKDNPNILFHLYSSWLFNSIQLTEMYKWIIKPNLANLVHWQSIITKTCLHLNCPTEIQNACNISTQIAPAQNQLADHMSTSSNYLFFNPYEFGATITRHLAALPKWHLFWFFIRTGQWNYKRHGRTKKIQYFF